MAEARRPQAFNLRTELGRGSDELGIGFAPVLWDSSRQAIQDKTARTVVIDLRGERQAEGAPPP